MLTIDEEHPETTLATLRALRDALLGRLRDSLILAIAPSLTLQAPKDPQGPK